MLEDCVPPERVLQERWQTKRGELECLINVASRTGLLPKELTVAAHIVRKAGNDALHGAPCSEEATWDVLVYTRRLRSTSTVSRRDMACSATSAAGRGRSCPQPFPLATRWRAAAESGADDGLIRTVEGGKGRAGPRTGILLTAT